MKAESCAGGVCKLRSCNLEKEGTAVLVPSQSLGWVVKNKESHLLCRLRVADRHLSLNFNNKIQSGKGSMVELRRSRFASKYPLAH